MTENDEEDSELSDAISPARGAGDRTISSHKSQPMNIDTEGNLSLAHGWASV